MEEKIKLTKEQARLLELTKLLEQKAKEYKELCKKLDKLKEANIDPNSPKLIVLRDQFKANLDEIQKINQELKILGK